MLNSETVRSHFPALASGAVFFDNPGGTQVAGGVIERMQQYFHSTNANHGGAFRTSRASDAMVAEARLAVADFLNAARPEEIVFGQNMTSLTLHMEEMERLITPRTKIVAVGYSSNAVGTINDVQRVVQLAHRVGALCFIDAVQHAPHKPIDVQALDCDFLACSAYKFFGPHTGILYGKYALLDALKAYKVRPSGNLPPDKFETGTQSFESIAGVLGALEYIAELGTSFGGDFAPQYRERFSGRKLALKQGMAAIEAYELGLNKALLEGLSTIPGLHIWGITDAGRMQQRVPTFSFSLQGWHPRAVAEEMAKANINVWDGNFYALAVLERLGLEEQGGIVRVGAAHYNTQDEIDRLVAALLQIAEEK